MSIEDALAEVRLLGVTTSLVMPGYVEVKSGLYIEVFDDNCNFIMGNRHNADDCQKLSEAFAVIAENLQTTDKEK